MEKQIVEHHAWLIQLVKREAVALTQFDRTRGTRLAFPKSILECQIQIHKEKWKSSSLIHCSHTSLAFFLPQLCEGNLAAIRGEIQERWNLVC
jgi:hypothetical protein